MTRIFNITENTNIPMSVPSNYRNQATAFPVFAPGVAFPSVYERAGFDVNKSLYGQTNGSQSSIRSGHSGRSQRTNRSNRSARAGLPPQIDTKLAAIPAVPAVPPLPHLAHPADPPSGPSQMGTNGGSDAFQGKGPGANGQAHGGSTSSMPRPTVSVSPRLEGTRYPYYHQRQRQGSQESNRTSSSVSSPIEPKSPISFSPTKQTAVLPSALQATPPPKAVGKGIFSDKNISQQTGQVQSPHNRQGSAESDISMVSALTSSSKASTESSQLSESYSSQHTNSFTDATSWDSETNELQPSGFKQNLLVPQHLDNRFSTTSSIYSMNPTMDHIPDMPSSGYYQPELADPADHGFDIQPEVEVPPLPDFDVVGLGVHGVDLGSNVTVAPAPQLEHSTFRPLRASIRNYHMTTPPLEIQKQSGPKIPMPHPRRGTSMESTTSGSTVVGSTAASASMPLPHVKMPKICRGCNGTIVKKGIKSRDGNLTGRWHRECFNCTTCRNPLQAEVYVLNNAPYCGECYHQANNSTCRGCGKGVEGTCMETRAENGNFGSYTIRYHSDCLRCVDCQCLLHDSYYVVDGGNYCYTHAVEAQPTDTRLERRYTRFAMI